MVAFGVASICLLNLRQISFNGPRLLRMVVAYFYTLDFLWVPVLKASQMGVKGYQIIDLNARWV